MELSSNQQAIRAWSYFSIAMILVMVAIFTLFVDPLSLEGGDKGSFYIVLVSLLGMLIEPIFGVFATPIVFICISLWPFKKWYEIIYSPRENRE